MRKFLTCLTMIMSLGFCLSMTACASQKNGTFSGIHEVHISTTMTEYDFSEGVSCTDEAGTVIDFEVDISDVKFGESGKYTAIYRAGESEVSTDVYIYGQPSIETNAVTISYAQANADNLDWTELIQAKDTFGTALGVSMEGTFEHSETGGVKVGAHTFHASAMDQVGNLTREEITVTVSAPTETIELTPGTVDFSNAYYTVEVGKHELLGIFTDGSFLDKTLYVSDNGHIMLLPTCLKTIGTGEKTLFFNFTDCVAELKLTVTDNAPVEYGLVGNLSNKIFLPSMRIDVPQAILLGENNIQNVEFRSYLKAGTEQRRLLLTDTFQLPDTDEIACCYELEIWRNNELEEELSQSFTVSVGDYYRQNFAEEAFVGDWIRNAPTASTLTFEEMTDPIGTTKSALKFHKAGATGADNLLNLIYFDPERIAAAKAAGFTTVRFYALTEDPEYTNRQLVIYRSPNGSTSGTEVKLLKYDVNAYKKWTLYEFSLEDFTSGDTIMLNMLVRTLYISEFSFLGRPIPIDDYTQNFAVEEFAELWRQSAPATSTVSFESVSDPLGETAAALKFHKPEGGDNLLKVLFLNPDLIAGAKAAGLTKVSFRYLVEDIEAEKQQFVLYRSFGGSTVASDLTLLKYDVNAHKKWTSLTVDLTDFEDGDTLLFNMPVNTLYIADLSFAVPDQNFDGIRDFQIKAEEIEYDFTEGVTCITEFGNTVPFELDHSMVKFGVPGRYQITYRAGNITATATVFIYGVPILEAPDSLSLTYREANGSIDWEQYAMAKDSFGVSLQISISGGLTFTETGSLKPGKHEIIISTEDSVGNLATTTLSVVVAQPTDSIDFPQNSSVDFSEARFTLDIGSRRLLNVYTNDGIVDIQCYEIQGEQVTLLPALFSRLGTGEKTLFFNFDSCSAEFSLEVTDNQDTAVALKGDFGDRIVLPGAEVFLPQAERIGDYNIQNFEVKMFLTEEDGVETAVSDPSVILPSEDETNYGIRIEIWRNGLKEKELTQIFEVSVSRYYRQNFASESLAGVWERNAPTASEIMFEKEVTVAEVSKNAMKFYKAGATGADNRNNMIWLSPELVEGAKAAGFTTLTFSYCTVRDPAGADARFVGYKDLTTSGLQIYKADASVQWFDATVPLNVIPEGETFYFNMLVTTLYIADVRFSGRPLTAADFEKNLASSLYLNVWMRSAPTASEILFEKNVTVSGVSKDAMKFYKAGATGADNMTNRIWLDPTVIAGAKAAGFTKLKFSYCTVQDPAGADARFVGYIQHAGTYKSVIYKGDASTQWFDAEISLADLATDDTIVMNMLVTTLYLSGVTFA